MWNESLFTYYSLWSEKIFLAKRAHPNHSYLASTWGGDYILRREDTFWGVTTPSGWETTPSREWLHLQERRISVTSTEVPVSVDFCQTKTVRSYFTSWTPIFCWRLYFVDAYILSTPIFCWRLYFVDDYIFFSIHVLLAPIYCWRLYFWRRLYFDQCLYFVDFLISLNYFSFLLIHFTFHYHSALY